MSADKPFIAASQQRLEADRSSLQRSCDAMLRFVGLLQGDIAGIDVASPAGAITALSLAGKRLTSLRGEMQGAMRLARALDKRTEEQANGVYR